MINEIIYILINQAMPGYVKIGRTTNLNQRLRSLYRTQVPLPFEVFYACTVENGTEVEHWLFDIFKDWRVSQEREFFEVSPESVATALRAKAIKEVTPKETYVESDEDGAALIKAQARRSVFNFKMVGIPVGAELVFSRDENIKVKVVDNRRVDYNGEVVYLAPLAQKLLGYSRLVQGAIYWKYKGETLDERRRRMESGE